MTAQVEVLSFTGCPHVRAAVALVDQVARETGVDIDLRLIDVPYAAAAAERAPVHDLRIEEEVAR